MATITNRFTERHLNYNTRRCYTNHSTSGVVSTAQMWPKQGALLGNLIWSYSYDQIRLPNHVYKITGLGYSIPKSFIYTWEINMTTYRCQTITDPDSFTITNGFTERHSNYNTRRCDTIILRTEGYNDLTQPYYYGRAGLQ
jgi:hypothetical protein